jgi:hypothetical protein|tara:strand:- start:449 stop:694 length:246 start_codon:yes stop_codon:yes gene_type:complete
MSKKIKHTPAAIFDMLEELQLSLEILEEKMDNIYDIVKSKPQKDYGYSNDDEYDDDDEDEDDDMNDNSFGWDDWYDEPKGE